MIHLEAWNKVAVLAGAAAAVALTILLAVCFVGEGCLIYEVLARRRGKKDQERRMSGTLYGSQGKAVCLTDYRSNGQRLPSSASSVSAYAAVSERADALAGRLRTDSTYSSMSSSTDTSSVRSASASVSSSSLPESLSPPPQEKPGLPALSFSLLATTIPESPTVKLAIAVESATDLPARDYGAHCDPWVSVTVIRDRRSLRRRPPVPLAGFRTKTIRHAHNPFYSQTFVADVQREDLKDVCVRFCVVDQDRYCGPVEIGSTSITIKEAKQTGPDPDKFSSTQILNPPKKDYGQIHFGLSFLPTAQRLSFNITKATNLKQDKEDGNEDDTTNPYVRILMFNGSGRLVKKKKTTVKVNTREPVFNETLNFEVGAGQLESSRFLVTLCSRKRELELDVGQEERTESFGFEDEEVVSCGSNGGRRESNGRTRTKDPCLGKMALGKSVRGEKEREHYRCVMATPRKVFSVTHTLR